MNRSNMILILVSLVVLVFFGLLIASNLRDSEDASTNGGAVVEEETDEADEEEANPETMVTLYYYNVGKDTDESGNVLCSRAGLQPVYRSLPEDEATVENAIELLLEGELTQAEKASGVSSEFPLEGLSLADTRLEDGVLTLTFEDPELKTSGGSCRVGVLWYQIEATALNFPEVEEVRFEPETLFQP